MNVANKNIEFEYLGLGWLSSDQVVCFRALSEGIAHSAYDVILLQEWAITSGRALKQDIRSDEMGKLVPQVFKFNIRRKIKQKFVSV